jgi:AhpD family alkylhydroperoxidase
MPSVCAVSAVSDRFLANPADAARKDVLMQSRMTHPVMLVPEAMQARNDLKKAADKGGLPERTAEMVQLRASQINGCSVCVDLHTRNLIKNGLTDENVLAAASVAAWQHTPYFSDGERAALALTESITRLSDRSDPVPDAVWEEAARHYNPAELAALVLHIANINTWNRLNVAIGQVAGQWTG